MTSTDEYLVSALLVKDLLEHCMASCLALLYIEITSTTTTLVEVNNGSNKFTAKSLPTR